MKLFHYAEKHRPHIDRLSVTANQPACNSEWGKRNQDHEHERVSDLKSYLPVPFRVTHNTFTPLN